MASLRVYAKARHFFYNPLSGRPNDLAFPQEFAEVESDEYCLGVLRPTMLTRQHRTISSPRTPWGVALISAIVCILSVFDSVAAPKKPQASVTQPRLFLECCDASAAVALDEHRFVVGDDETSLLRIYDWRIGGTPSQTFNLQPFLDPDAEKGEADIEAAARLGDVVFWLTSHGKSPSGKARPDRNRIFATTFQTNAGKFSMELVGKPYEKLLRDLIAGTNLAQFGFRAATKRAPKEDQSLNFEGLCATTQGTLLLGFRNPAPQGKALLIPLLNPLEIIRGKARASLGAPVLLDLGGLTIRDLVFRGGYIYILAGPWQGGQDRRIYRWDGVGSKADLVTPVTLDRFHSEVLFAFPEQSADIFTILSDDGSRKTGGVDCKDLPVSRRAFRAFEWKTIQLGRAE